ncbi:hypothetical protein V491_04983 [Pseudogymnoascus sp. VKM F-3775]|nr:hypothetical protein V491_04983 [Pseudogymnoascus sp. VKM F-3775]
MKDNATHLYPNEQVSEKVAEYAFEHSTKLPEYITKHHAWGSDQPKAGFMISPFQTQFQIWFARALGAKRILEIGCYIGFSALGFSEAVGPDGHVTTLEFDPEYAQIARETFEKNGVKNVEVIVGDANKSIPELALSIDQPYDLIFIDADKISYPNYLSLILSLSTSSSPIRLLKSGGTIIADNILRRGVVADRSSANPNATPEEFELGEGGRGEQLVALDRFNKDLVESDRIETFLLPLFDGLGMGRLKD